MLIVKRKRHTPTVQYDQESKVRIYDEVEDPVKTSKDTKVYQELEVKKMDDTKQYAAIKWYLNCRSSVHWLIINWTLQDSDK